MIYVGIDPGSETYAFAFVDEIGNLVKYFEIPTDLIEKDAVKISKMIADYRPVAIALPSGHGLPFYKIKDINNKEIFLLTLKDPNAKGPLRDFLIASKQYLATYNSFTIPSVIELESVSIDKKNNIIDKGTADKVASAFFYRVFFTKLDYL